MAQTDEESRRPLKIRFAPAGFTPLPEEKYYAQTCEIFSVYTKYGPSIEFRFEILSGKYEGKVIGKRLTTGRVGDTLWQWIKIFTGMECDDLKEYDLNNLLNKRCFIRVERGNRIVEIFPLEDHDEPT